MVSLEALWILLFCVYSFLFSNALRKVPCAGSIRHDRTDRTLINFVWWLRDSLCKPKNISVTRKICQKLGSLFAVRLQPTVVFFVSHFTHTCYVVAVLQKYFGTHFYSCADLFRIQLLVSAGISGERMTKTGAGVTGLLGVGTNVSSSFICTFAKSGMKPVKNCSGYQAEAFSAAWGVCSIFARVSELVFLTKGALWLTGSQRHLRCTRSTSEGSTTNRQAVLENVSFESIAGSLDASVASFLFKFLDNSWNSLAKKERYAAMWR